MKSLALLACVLLLSGCGRSYDDTKNSYLKSAEQICIQADAQTQALTKPKALADFAPYVRCVVGIATATTSRLEALQPPAKDRADLRKRVIEPLREQTAGAQRFADDVEAATKRHDKAALVRLGDSAPPVTRADLDYMRAYGFQACVDLADSSSSG